MASELRVNQITSQTGLGTVTFDAAGGVTFAASPLFSATGSIGIGTAIPRSRFHIYSPDTRPFEVWAGTAGTSFSVNSAGNIEIGTGNIIFSTAGRGIDFSATANSSGTMTSELFADYEEGTWTGTLQMHSDSSNVSTTNTNLNSTGIYVKVGNLVFVSINFDVTAYNAYVAKQIIGLPYTSISGYESHLSMGHLRGIRFVYSTSILTALTTSATVQSNSTTINLQASSTSSAFSGWYYISNESGQGKNVFITGVYRSA